MIVNSSIPNGSRSRLGVMTVVVVAFVSLAGCGTSSNPSGSTVSDEMTQTQLDRGTHSADNFASPEEPNLTPIPFDEVFSEFRVFETLNPTIEVWTVQNGIAVGRNSSEESSYFLIGDDEWQDYVVEFDILIPESQTLYLGVSSGLVGRGREFGMVEIQPRQASWHALRIKVVHQKLRVVDRDTSDIFFEGETPYDAGGIMLFLPVDEQMALRNVRWRVDRAKPFEPPLIEPPPIEPIESDDSDRVPPSDSEAPGESDPSTRPGRSDAVKPQDEDKAADSDSKR